jgi:predicted DCC family thiol-disulfide oxidoreductase YuxK
LALMAHDVGQPTLIYDGDCAFCSSAARWVSRRWTRQADAVAWQRLGTEGLADLGLREDDVRRAAYWVEPDGRLFRGHAAVARALGAGDGWMRAASLALSAPPGSWLARPAYWLVARYRHRLPGATDACRL